MKAINIARAKELNIVVRCLGGFHLFINLWAAWAVLWGFGLGGHLLLCYGHDTVPHMMTGKAYARALRGHLLVDGAA